MTRCVIWLLFLVFLGCTQAVERREISGIYDFKLENIKQKVVIGEDGKYVNKFFRDDILVWADNGTWTYEKAGKQTGIALAEFRFALPEYSLVKYGIPGNSSGRGLWFVVPEKTVSGMKQLCFDPDLDRCFRASS